MSELRWHPLLEQWVVVATHRQERPQMPEDWCPFCPGSGRVPDDYDVYLYPNDFPAFSFDDPQSPGACDVVLYSPRHDLLPSQLTVEQWSKVIALWARRTAALKARPEVRYVAVFENTGAAIGVTMPHPHGQIYGFPFVPPLVEREMIAAAAFEQRTGGCLYCRVLADELAEGRRVVAENASFAAFAPYWARFPWEVQIYARDHVAALSEADGPGLAAAISLIRKKYDGLYDFPIPLMMVVRQEVHLHVEFLPIQRSATKLKYLAAVETAHGTFLNDTLPEECAEQLRAVAADIRP